MKIKNGGDTLQQEEAGTTQLPDELDELLQEIEEDSAEEDDSDPDEDSDSDDDSSTEDDEC